MDILYKIVFFHLPLNVGFLMSLMSVEGENRPTSSSTSFTLPLSRQATVYLLHHHDHVYKAGLWVVGVREGLWCWAEMRTGGCTDAALQGKGGKGDRPLTI